MSNQGSMSDSEFAGSIKLNMNYANLRGVSGSPANAANKPNVRCRRCGNENSIENIPHIIGSCSFSERRRNARHDMVVNLITKLLREKGFLV